MKRKLGLALGPLKLMSKSKSRNKVTHSTDDSLDDAPSISAETPLMERPPPLDPKTEKELKEACAVVLHDLKPSGYDIEDNRMKSDMLVDDDESRDADADVFRQTRVARDPPRSAPVPQIREPPRPPKPKRDKSHSSAAWIINNHDEADKMVNPQDLVKESESQQLSRSTTESDTPTAKPTPTSSKPAKQSPAPRLQPQEAPLAPVSTTVNESRQDLASPPKQVVSPPIRSPEYSDTNASSSLAASTDQTKSGSTAHSATPFTPSQHASRHGSGNVYNHPTLSEDEEWMRKGVEKHRQAQESANQSNQISPELPNVSSYTRNSPKVTAVDRPASRNRLREQSSKNSPQAFQDARSRPESQTRKDESSTMSSPSSPRSFGPTHPTSKKSSRPASARSTSQDHIIKDTPGSPIINFESPDIPPVPRLDAHRKSQLSSGNLSPAVPPRRFDGEQSAKILEQKLSDLRDKTDEPLASPRSREFRLSSQAKQSALTSDAKTGKTNPEQVPLSKYSSPPQTISTGKTQPSTQDTSDLTKPGTTSSNYSTIDPLTHQHDPSVFVRDFYQPNDRRRSNSGPTSRDRQKPKRSLSTELDPTSASADFDSLMSVVHAPAGETSRFNHRSRSTLHISDAHGSRTSPGLSRDRSQNSGHSATAPQLTDVSVTSASPNEARSQEQPLASSTSPAEGDSNPSLPTFSISNANSSDPNTDTRNKTPPPMSPTGRPSASSAPSGSQTDSNVHQRQRSSTTSEHASHAVSSSSPRSANSQQDVNVKKERLRPLPKLFHKLGGGEMPVRQKVYVPGSGEATENRELEQRRASSLHNGSGGVGAANGRASGANGTMTSNTSDGQTRNRTTTILENRVEKVKAPYAGMTGAYGGSLLYGIGVDGENGGDDDDSDYDEFACAAPVIGFGRGW